MNRSAWACPFQVRDRYPDPGAFWTSSTSIDEQSWWKPRPALRDAIAVDLGDWVTFEASRS